MRKMLLSFRSDVYDRVLAGTKIYEHRKVFPDEMIEAYLYVSSPRQVITGKIILNNRQLLSDWLIKYKGDIEICDRINCYLKEHKYVMEIAEFQETSEIPLKDLRNDLDKFVVPQMYYYLDNTPLLSYIENNIKFKGKHIINSFDNVDRKYICN